MAIIEPGSGKRIDPGTIRYLQLQGQRASEIGPVARPAPAAGTHDRPATPRRAAQPAPPPVPVLRELFSWLLTGRILLGLTVMWVIGVALDLGWHFANPLGPVVFAAAAGILSAIAYAAARHQRG